MRLHNLLKVSLSLCPSWPLKFDSVPTYHCYYTSPCFLSIAFYTVTIQLLFLFTQHYFQALTHLPPRSLLSSMYSMWSLIGLHSDLGLLLSSGLSMEKCQMEQPERS